MFKAGPNLFVLELLGHHFESVWLLLEGRVSWDSDSEKIKTFTKFVFSYANIWRIVCVLAIDNTK